MIKLFKPQLPSRKSVALCCVLLLAGFATRSSYAQEIDVPEVDTARAIKLYADGNIDAAISLLQSIVEKREDADAWRFLAKAYADKEDFMEAGPALKRYISLRPNDAEAFTRLASILSMRNDIRGAGDAAKRALELGAQNAEVHYVLGESNLEAGNPGRALQESEIALTLDPNCTGALFTKARALHELKRDREAVEALSAFLTAKPDADDADLLRDELKRWQAALQPPQQTTTGPQPITYPPNEVSKKARILSKASPEYTEKARKAGIIGTVILSLVLSSSGEVTDIRVLRWLRGGLTTEAVKAARKITFEPATKDEKPVSQFVRMEYNFNVY